MTTKTWVGGATGTWGTASAWSPQGAPGAGDDVTIGAGSNVAITSSITSGSVTLGGPAAMLTLETAGVYADIEGTLGGSGVVLLGSPDTAHPAELLGVSLTLGAGLSVDVTGAAELGLFETYETTGMITLAAGSALNVGPGGSLQVLGRFSGLAAIHIASGSLDLSGALDAAGSAAGIPDTGTISFDNGAGKLTLDNGQAAEIAGFRTGDTIDVKGISVSGPISRGSNGVIAVGATDLVIAGPTAPGATYTAAPDGSGGTLVTTTAQPAATVAFSDQTTGASGSHALDAASGGPSYLQWQYLDSGADTVAMSAGVPNVFLKGGSGEKALAVTSGQNVLDGGTGSAFLAGGSGTDTFFVDVRGTAQVWDTLTNFRAGDAVTVWGWSPASGTETVDALAGAVGYQGATLRLANGQGGPMSSVTFAGLSSDQVAHLQMSTGTAGGVPYLYIQNPRV